MTLQLHRPDGQGGLQKAQGRPASVGEELRAQRWRAAKLQNTEMNPTSTPMSVLFWLGLGAVTFVLLMLGYGTGFWHL